MSFCSLIYILFITNEFKLNECFQIDEIFNLGMHFIGIMVLVGSSL